MSLLRRIMRARGLSEEFLEPKYGDFPELPGAKAAAERLVRAVSGGSSGGFSGGERILIYGDYDADGVTASLVIREALRLAAGSSAGASDFPAVEVMLPDRFKDGYGMSERLVERAVKEKVDLVVTVDCGSNNREIIEKLQAAGVEVVVTDHHEILGELPECIVVNPKRKDVEAGELRELAGVGVAFMVAYEMMKMGAIPEGQEKWLLDLVLLGTVCDSMKMTGVNRALCFYGAKVLSKTRRAGLLELMRRAGVRELSTEAIGFQIGPRINAAGRMKSAEVALNLLAADDEMMAAKLAEEVEGLNRERKAEQQRAVREIAERGTTDEPVLVEAGAWHEGVLGIIAGRLVEDYRRPAFVLSETEPGVLKGSGRSFGEFSLAEAISECQNSLVTGGGHAGACGVKVLKTKLEEFTEAVNKYYKSLGLKNQERFLEVKEDLTLGDFGEINVGAVEELRRLEPFGEGNTEPVFKLENVLVTGVRKMGEEEQHVRITVADGEGRTLSLLSFYAPEEWREIRGGERINAWVSLGVNEWNGVKSAEGRILRIGVVK